VRLVPRGIVAAANTWWSNYGRLRRNTDRPRWPTVPDRAPARVSRRPDRTPARVARHPGGASAAGVGPQPLHGRRSTPDRREPPATEIMVDHSTGLPRHAHTYAAPHRARETDTAPPITTPNWTGQQRPQSPDRVAHLVRYRGAVPRRQAAASAGDRSAPDAPCVVVAATWRASSQRWSRVCQSCRFGRRGSGRRRRSRRSGTGRGCVASACLDRR
jgi:hypothetical protein